MREIREYEYKLRNKFHISCYIILTCSSYKVCSFRKDREKSRRVAHVPVGRVRVKESMREIIVCGLPCSKASRISGGLIKPRAAVVGGLSRTVGR